MAYQIVHAVGATVYLVFFVLFICAGTVPRTNPGVSYWALAVLSAFFARLSIWWLTALGDASQAFLVYAVFIVLEKVCLLAGTALFFGRALSQRWLFIVALAGLGWITAQYSLQLSSWIFAAGLALFNVLALIFVTRTLYLSELQIPRLIRHAAILACSLLALHWCLLVPVYSWWQPEWRADGFILGTSLALMQYLALLAAVFALFQKRLLHSEAKALEMAYQDPLTGLCNKRYVDVLFQQVLQLANRPHQTLALFYIDLDKFKPINDSAGHHTGDLVLKEVATRLKSCLRSTDICARVGGDEFVVIATQLDKEQDATEIAAKLLKQLQAPVMIGSVSYELGASIGVSMHPLHGKELAELLDKADKAMYQVKQQGRNGYRFFEAPQNSA